MSDVSGIQLRSPVDVVIAWVDGSDPRLSGKRLRYINNLPGKRSDPGSRPTRFASNNEIRYCLLSILRFAPFVRNIYIVTDEQDPGLYDDVKRWFPAKSGSLKIIDHKEIFEGFESFLPTFNSISIGNMIWRIKGLSENFVYFNDDTFLIREIRPEDWFAGNEPVLRGKWVAAPYPRILWDDIKILINRYLAGNSHYVPRASFHLGQWRSAALLGYRLRYFTNSHTPHTVNRKTVEDFFMANRELLEKNISYRFRHPGQFTFISLSNHLQLLSGNNNIASPSLAYLQPYNRPEGYTERKLQACADNADIKYLCVQSLDMCSREDEKKIFDWMEELLGINSSEEPTTERG